ncbi:MAG TPA: glycosyltransferase family 4 protein [Vicinamibacterales bacterium]|nr:glycosyltransferase family 4 protein [Vicinamibacterales bacterium]
MNILSITAGAADMFCGSCLRDNALAAELIARGHQVTLLPVYTPTVTDEPNMSSGQPVFFGGISVYLQQHLALFRHTPWLLDRIWDAPSVIKSFATGAINVDPRMLGALTVSTLRGEGGYQRKEVDKLMHWLAGEAAPDVVNLPNSLLIALAAPIRRVLQRPIVVTLQGEDLFLEGLPEPYKAQAIALIRERVRDVDLFVSISDYYTGYMADYLSIPLHKIRTVPLGINIKDFERLAPLARSPFTIGYFARIAPEKGLHNLAEAYRVLRQDRGLPPSRLAAAGYLGAGQQSYLDGITRQLRSWGLADEFVFSGTVDRSDKSTFFQSLDVLSVPSGYHEPKGLYLLEAMASGVPVVEPNHGAFPELLDRTGGGLVAKSEHPSDIADALFEIYRQPARAAALGAAGAAGVRRSYTINHMTDRMLEVYADAVSATTH